MGDTAIFVKQGLFKNKEISINLSVPLSKTEQCLDCCIFQSKQTLSPDPPFPPNLTLFEFKICTEKWTVP